MPRLLTGFVLFLLTTLATLAADAPAGSWKLTLRSERQPILVLISFAQTDGKWVADYIDSTAQFNKDPKFIDVKVVDDNLKFTLIIDAATIRFDGIVAKDGKKITGSLNQGTALELTELRPSTLKKIDGFELVRESLTQTDEPQAVYDASLAVLAQAAAKKLKPDEVRGMVDRVMKLSTNYGPRWERATTLKFAGLLADQEGYAEIALAQARKAERMLTDDDESIARLEVLNVLARSLTKSNKADEAKPYLAQIAKLELRDYQDYAKKNPSYKIEEFKGRKAKSNRVALVELFSSAELPACAGFDLARDGVLRAYKSSDAIALTYHMNLKDANDPLTNPDTVFRVNFYAAKVKTGTLAFVNGKPAVRITEETSAESAKDIYAALREKIEEELEKPSAVKLTLTVAADPKGFVAKAAIADLEKPSEQMFLRFAVFEDRVRYFGGNGMRYHQHVVRSMPGGKGFALTKATAEHSVTVNATDIRDKLTKYLEDFSKESDFPRADRPLELKNLKLVAFVQNDSTGEVLDAAQVDLEPKKE